MTAITVRYSKLIVTDLAARSINFSESGMLGHRVQIPVSVDDLNTLFVWDRTAGSSRPVGHFNSAGLQGNPFDSILTKALSSYYSDIDGVLEGLHFSSSILDANTDPRIRQSSIVSANDLVMAYVLYKCYGSSSSSTKDTIYNLEDAYSMLSNESFLKSIERSLEEEEALSSSPYSPSKGAVDAMFRELLVSDPQRFFDAHGNQAAGLFETNVDSSSSGSWNFVQDDKIEFRVQFTFQQPVTKRATGDSDSESTVVIPAGSTFFIRLQLLATDTEEGMKAKQALEEEEQEEAADSRIAAATKAAANAAAFVRASQEQQQAAAAQKAAAQTRYEQAVKTSAAQATAAEVAHAAASAAQDAYAQAIASGTTEENLQAQRAAAEKARAVAINAQAIADAAASELQNSYNVMNAAIAALNTSQTAVATAASQLAKANATAAAAALQKAQADAAAAALQKAQADAASDPFTQTLTLAQQLLLDPQTLNAALTTYNSKTNARLAAQLKELNSAAALATQKALYTSASNALAYAINGGSSIESIQMLRSSVVCLGKQVETAQDTETATGLALTTAYLDEFTSLQNAHTIEKNAAQLRVDLATMSLNDLTAKATAANATYTKASSAYTAAVQAKNTAQNALTLTIKQGATAEETQVQQSTLLQAQATVASTKQQMDQANVLLLQANAARDAQDVIVQSVTVSYNDSVAASLAKETAFLSAQQSDLAAFQAFQQEATLNQAIKTLVDLHIEAVNAQVTYQTAAAHYATAVRAVNVALALGETEPQILALRLAVENAAKVQLNAKLLFQAQTTAYQTASQSASESPNGKAILEGSAKQLLQQISNAKINTIALAYNKTLQDQANAVVAADAAKKTYQLAQKTLSSAITNGAPLSSIIALRNAVSHAAIVYAQATSNVTAAAAAAKEARKNVIPATYPAPAVDAVAWFDASLTSSVTTSDGGVTAWSSTVGTTVLSPLKGTIPYTTVNGVEGIELQGFSNYSFSLNSDYSNPSIPISSNTVIFAVMTVPQAPSSNVFFFYSPALPNSSENVVRMSITPSNSSFTLGTATPTAGSFGTTFSINGSPSTPVNPISIQEGPTFQLNGTANNPDLTSESIPVALNLVPSTNSDMYYHELIVVNGPVSEQKRQQMEGYLAWKWGINESLPPAHPYYPPPSNDLPADPNVLALLAAAQLLQSSQQSNAYQNDLVANFTRQYDIFSKALATYNTAQAIYSAAVADLQVATSGGTLITPLAPLQTAVQKAATALSSAVQSLDAATTQLMSDQNDASGNPATLAVFDTFVKDASGASTHQLQSTLVNLEILAKETRVAAQNSLTEAQARYSVLQTQLQTALLQGKPTTTLQHQLQAASNVVAQATSKFTLATAAVTKATDLLTTTGSLATPLQTILNTVHSILETSKQVQAIAIQGAKSNQLTINLIDAQQTFVDAVNANQAAVSAVTLANTSVQAALTAGASIDQLQQLRTTLEQAQANQANAKAALDAASSALTYAQTTATADPSVTAILQAAGAAQSAAIAGATANSLVQRYDTAKGVALQATADYSHAYSAFLVASQALSTAIQQGKTADQIKTLQQTVLTTGSAASVALAAMNGADAAANAILQQINLNPNVKAIQEAAVSSQLSSAAIETRVGLGVIAVQAQQALQAAQTTFTKAKQAHTIAKAALDSAIVGGAGVSDLQALQATIAKATAALTTAQYQLDYDQTAYMNAYSAAGLDTDAYNAIEEYLSTVEFQAQGTAANLAKLILKQANEALTLATTKKDLSNADLQTATTALQTATDASGMIPQEIVKYEQAVAKATEVANAAQIVFGLATTKVLALSGFSFNPSVGRYILSKALVPRVVKEGVSFYIGTIKVTPIDTGVYTPNVAYSLGSLIYYPTLDDSQYVNISAGPIPQT